jgi:hypothetical protein
VSDGVHLTSEGVGRSLGRLRDNVSRKEAVNEAKRGMIPVNSRGSSNQLSRQWNRLEALSKYQENSNLVAQENSPEPEDEKTASNQ